jgi:hypothetical protein
MNKIITKEITAKDNNTYYFKLDFESPKEDFYEYYNIKVFNEKEIQVGSMSIVNKNQKKLIDQINNDPLFDLKYFIEEEIGYTGLRISEDNEIKMTNREEFKDFCTEFLDLDSISLKNEKDKNRFLEELSFFMETYKIDLISTVNIPRIGLVYISDGEENGKEDLRGLGIGKKLYTYAAQWLGANDLKLYTNDTRTENALNIWKSFKINEDFNYGKNEHGEFISRNDGIIIENNIENVILKKQEEINNINKVTKKNKQSL